MYGISGVLNVIYIYNITCEPIYFRKISNCYALSFAKNYVNINNLST
jgi:hypothetical protein